MVTWFDCKCPQENQISAQLISCRICSPKMETFDSRQPIFAFPENKTHLPVSLPSLVLFNRVDFKMYTLSTYFWPKREQRQMNVIRRNPFFCENLQDEHLHYISTVLILYLYLQLNCTCYLHYILQYISDRIRKNMPAVDSKTAPAAKIDLTTPSPPPPPRSG